MGQDVSTALARVRTPRGRGSWLAAIARGRAVPALVARIAIWIARRTGKPLKIGKRYLAVRHQDVMEMLRRDLDFVIAPVNADRIEAVNGGPFILGMDRSPPLIRERGALYRALARLDMAQIEAGIRSDIATRLAGPGETFDALGDFARPVAVATAQRVFGIAPDDEMLFAESVRSIFAHTFLNLKSDKAVEARAREGGRLMQGWFADEIARRRAQGEPGDDLMGLLLRDRELDDHAVRRSLGGMLVGSIDTTTGCVARILGVAFTDRSLRAGIEGRFNREQDIYGLCLEALRVWPHNPILLRSAATDTRLAGKSIPQGARVIAFTQAAMQDRDVFPDPGRLIPDRPREPYLHFGAGLHPCAGRDLNAVQIPLLVGALVARGAAPAGKMQWAGPFPDRLPVRLARGATP